MKTEKYVIAMFLLSATLSFISGLLKLARDENRIKDMLYSIINCVT